MIFKVLVTSLSLPIVISSNIIPYRLVYWGYDDPEDKLCCRAASLFPWFDQSIAISPAIPITDGVV